MPRKPFRRRWGLFCGGMFVVCLLAGVALRPLSPLDGWGLITMAMFFLVCAAVRSAAGAILDAIDPRVGEHESTRLGRRLTGWLPALRDEVDEDYEAFVRAMQDIERSEREPPIGDS